MSRFARALARRFGYHLVRADHYSPIPDIEALPAALWDEPAPMPQVDLRLDAGLALLEGPLAPFVAEHERVENPMYPAVDSEVLHAMVRWLEPRRIVEVGAGFSTQVIRAALDAASKDCAHRIFDPLADVEGAEPIAAEDIDAAVFAALEANDILFIDTTHTVKPGGDVVRLLLEVLPALAPGVVVHIHDFFRPFEYPRWFMEQHGLYWQEQYLVQALLVGDRFEVLLANHALGRLHHDRLAALVPGVPDGVSPGSALWLRVRGA
jgi:hypothetical protein